MGAPDVLITILAVSDLERAAAFYETVFGWPRRVDVDVYVEFALPRDGGLGLYRRASFDRNAGHVPPEVPAGAISGTELYVRCTDVDAVLARLRAAGARELSPLAPRDWGDDAAYVADLDGNVIAVARPTR